MQGVCAGREFSGANHKALWSYARDRPLKRGQAVGAKWIATVDIIDMRSCVDTYLQELRSIQALERENGGMGRTASAILSKPTLLYEVPAAESRGWFMFNAWL